MLRRLIYLLLASFLSIAPAHAQPSLYYAPPAQVHAVMQVMDNGFANVTALFRNATGSFKFDEMAKSLGDLKIAIDATSLLADNDNTMRALAGMLGSYGAAEIRVIAPDTVTFQDAKAEIKANVTLRGQSKPVTFTATLNRAGPTMRSASMWSNEGQATGLTLQAALKRAEFGLTDDAAAPAHFGDTITLTIDLEALKQ